MTDETTNTEQSRVVADCPDERLVILCPDCHGDGEYYRGSSVPDDEGYEECRLCNGEGKFEPITRIRELLAICDASEGNYYHVLGMAQEAGIKI